jgi:predicted ATP-grasp superfamily ATP-dependent carboligase
MKDDFRTSMINHLIIDGVIHEEFHFDKYVIGQFVYIMMKGDIKFAICITCNDDLEKVMSASQLLYKKNITYFEYSVLGWNEEYWDHLAENIYDPVRGIK